MDLSGKLIIKAQLGDDIRRIPIHNEDITYDELMLMMQRVYRGKLRNSDDIMLKYKDEDNDLITIFDDSDLSFAIQCSRILKITLFVNGQPQPLESNQIKQLKTELQHIRDRVIQIIDSLEPPSDITSSVDTGTKEEPMVTESARPVTQRGQARPTNSAHSKEFDPLSSQKAVEEKVMSSFGIGTERSGTPDSITSTGSGSSNYRQQQQHPSTPSTPQHMPPPQQTVAPIPQQQGFQPVQPQAQHQPQQHPGQPGYPPQPQQHMYQQQPNHDQRQQMPGQQQQQQGVSGYGVPGQPPTSQPQRFPSPQQPMSQQQQPMPSPVQPGYAGQPQQSPQMNQQMNPQQPQQQYGYQGYGGQNPQQPPNVTQAPWNQQQNVYQGYAGQPQPQPGAMPTSSPSGTPGSASPNPYSRGPGSGYSGGYPKPAQAYPATSQGYK